jgi:5-formyltetrahydrofolate cyclo-ligase
VNPRAIDLVILPLVAFDDACQRMGMGAGYYDRTFAWKLQPHRWRGPRLVGYAHALQQVPAVDAKPWDVPMDAVITEKALVHCKPKRKINPI